MNPTAMLRALTTYKLRLTTTSNHEKQKVNNGAGTGEDGRLMLKLQKLGCRIKS